MPDTAFTDTEEQFLGLLDGASGDQTIAVRLHTLEKVPRGEQAAARIRPSLPKDVELIVADRTLDRGGIELLRDLLQEPDPDPAAGVVAGVTELD